MENNEIRMETRPIRWPEVMVTAIREKKVMMRKRKENRDSERWSDLR